jgi:hypothetical protein
MEFKWDIARRSRTVALGAHLRHAIDTMAKISRPATCQQQIAVKLPYALQQEAKKLGTLAHKNGRKCVPAHDASFLPFTREANPSGEIGHPMTIKILHAWLRGWHAANLAS